MKFVTSWLINFASRNQAHYLCFLGAVLLSPAIVLADTETKSSLWTMSLNRFQFTEQYRGFLDIQPRFTVEDVPGGDNGSIDTVLIRGALGYQLNSNLGIYQGYAIIPTYDPDRVEHRSFQELLSKTVFEWCLLYLCIGCASSNALSRALMTHPCALDILPASLTL